MGTRSSTQRGAVSNAALSTTSSVVATAATATSIFTAAAASNAIPIAGQFVAVGLALAGLFTKIFTAKKAKKKEMAAAKRKEALGDVASKVNPQANRSSGPGLAPDSPVGTTAPVTPPQTPSYSTWGGGVSPSIQPTQAALNNSIGIK